MLDGVNGQLDTVIASILDYTGLDKPRKCLYDRDWEWAVVTLGNRGGGVLGTIQ